MEESLKRQRGNPPTTLELLVVVYVVGFIWQETQEIFGSGIRGYLKDMWNFIDFSRNALYSFVFLLRAIAYIQQTNQVKVDPSTAFLPRETWDDFDPQLIVSLRKFIVVIGLRFTLMSIDRRRDFSLPPMFSQLSSSCTCSPLIHIWGHFKSLSGVWLLTL